MTIAVSFIPSKSGPDLINLPDVPGTYAVLQGHTTSSLSCRQFYTILPRHQLSRTRLKEIVEAENLISLSIVPIDVADRVMVMPWMLHAETH